MTYVEQEKEALRLINKYGSPWMLNDDEAIGEIINTAISCRLKHNPEKSKISTYLISGVKRKISRLNTKRSKNFMYEISENVVSNQSNTELNDFIQNVKNISDEERKLIYLYYYDKYTLEELGKMFELSKERIRQKLEITLTKLREYKDVLVEK